MGQDVELLQMGKRNVRIGESSIQFQDEETVLPASNAARLDSQIPEATFDHGPVEILEQKRNA